MPTITYQNRRIQLDNHENLLHALEKAGIDVPCSCGSGICHGCMAEATSGTVPEAAQQGLSANQRRLNYFLTCQCHPQQDLEIALVSNLEGRRNATLIEKTDLSPAVIRARFEADLDWRPGQHITLWKSEFRGRVYSIASLPDEGHIELHIRKRPDGVVSQWLDRELCVGDSCQFSQPAGTCYYSPAMPGQPLLLVGTGTGLAPLYGILKQALSDGHHGHLTLYAAAGEPQQLYLTEELSELSAKRTDFDYFPVVRRNPRKVPAMVEGDLTDLIPLRHPRLRNHLVYLCGTPTMVDILKNQCFFAGALMEDIFTNTFTPGS